jgi:hypothetical protein
VNTKDNSLGAASGRQLDRRNRRRVTLWSLAWALSFIVVSLGIKKLAWPFGAIVAGVAGTTLLGLATVLAYRRFLLETDELRRKIEVEALALAFGIGVFGGLSFWLLAVSGAVSATSFAYLFAAMILTHSVGVYLGCRRYS